MKNSRRLTALLSLVLLVVPLLTPASVRAAQPTSVSFQGSGNAWIAGDQYDQKWKGPNNIAKGEPVDIVLNEVTGWNELIGAQAITVHHGVIHIQPDSSFQGRLSGEFVLTALDGCTLRGNMSGAVTVSADGNTISDSGTWLSTGGTGDHLQDAKVQGTWKVVLYWNDGLGTYFGDIEMDGTARLY